MRHSVKTHVSFLRYRILKKTAIFQQLWYKWFFSNMRYREKETSILTECFTIHYHRWYLLFDKISVRSAYVQFFYKFPSLGRKVREMITTLKERPKDTNSFRLFLISVSPAYEQNMSPNGTKRLEMFPRYKLLKVFLYMPSRFQKGGFDVENKPRLSLFHKYGVYIQSTK